MEMSRFEKRFVNRKKKSERNIKKFESALDRVDKQKNKTVLEIGCYSEPSRRSSGGLGKAEADTKKIAGRLKIA